MRDCPNGTPQVKDGLISAAGDFEDKRFPGTIGGKVEIDPPSQLGGVDPDDIVLAPIIGFRATEYPGPNLLFVELGAVVFEGLQSDVQQKIAQTRRLAELLTGSNTLDQGSALFDAGRISNRF